VVVVVVVVVVLVVVLVVVIARRDLHQHQQREVRPCALTAAAPCRRIQAILKRHVRRLAQQAAGTRGDDGCDVCCKRHDISGRMGGGAVGAR
jgi:hypothetical protein